MLDNKSEDKHLRAIATEIESREIIPNHNEIIGIIQNKIHLAQADKELKGVLMKYIRHVAVFKAMRAAGDDQRFPQDLGEPWPTDLFPLIEKKTVSLQADFDRSLSTTLQKSD